MHRYIIIAELRAHGGGYNKTITLNYVHNLPGSVAKLASGAGFNYQHQVVCDFIKVLVLVTNDSLLTRCTTFMGT